MPSSTARSTTRRCSSGLPRTISPAFPPQPKPISETRSSVLPTWRYSTVASFSCPALTSCALPANGVADVPLGGRRTEDDAAFCIVTNAHDLAVAPGIGDHHLMPAAPQLDEYLRGEAGFGYHPSGIGPARIEGGGEVDRVERRGIQGLLQVHTECHIVEEEL